MAIFGAKLGKKRLTIYSTKKGIKASIKKK